MSEAATGSPTGADAAEAADGDVGHDAAAANGGPVLDPLLAVQEYKLPRQQRAFLGRVGRAMLEAVQVIGKS